MTTPRDDIDGLIERLRADLGDWVFDPTYDARIEAATQLAALSAMVKESFQKYVDADEARIEAERERDALSGRVKELEGNQERVWCTACGTVTRDKECDCTIHELSCGEPHFVNYADAMQKGYSAAHARAIRLQQERDDAYERAAKVAESEPRVWDVSAPDPQQRIAAAIRQLAAGNEKEKK